MSEVTKRALEQSLKNLLLKKPLTKITINDITEDCGINRMTFYYHFKDIYDLVEWSCLEDARKALEEKKTHDTWQEGFLNIFEAVLANKPFIMNATAPAINVKENEKNYTMEVAAPGLKKEWVRVNIDNDGNLNIAIENKMEHKNEDKHEHYLRREFSYSNYQQAYTLPEDADREKISAKVADGVLEVEIPKLTPKEEAKTTKNIEVK